VDIRSLVENFDSKNAPSHHKQESFSQHEATAFPPELNFQSFNLRGNLFADSPQESNDFCNDGLSGMFESPLSTPPHVAIYPALTVYKETSTDSSTFSGFTKSRNNSVDSNSSFREDTDSPKSAALKSKGKNLNTVKEYSVAGNKKGSTKSLREHLTTSSAIVKQKKSTKKSKITRTQESEIQEVIKVSLTDDLDTLKKSKKTSTSRKRKDESSEEPVKKKTSRSSRGRPKKKTPRYDSDEEEYLDEGNCTVYILASNSLNNSERYFGLNAEILKRKF